MSLKRSTTSWMMLIACFCLLALAIPAFAQATPIRVGENATGTLSAEAPTAQFAFTAAGGESAAIQLLGLTPGFAPRLQVLNTADVEILALPNPTAQSILTGNVSFSDAGVYTIVVSGENGSVGQFVLSLQPGTPLPAPTPLTLDQPVTGSVGSANPVAVYSFSTSPAALAFLSFSSQTPNAGASVTLYDETARKTIASSDASLVGVTYQLPAVQGAYRVEVHASAAGDTSYTICAGNCAGLSSGGAASVPTPELVAPTQQAAACTASSSAGGSVNLRTGPGTNYAALATLGLGQTVQVVGQWTNGGWYAVNAGTQQLWVGASVVTLSGDCAALPLLNAPTNAPLAPTQVPTQPAQPAPTAMPPNTTPEVEPTTDSTPLPNLTVINVRLTTSGAGTLLADITVVNAGPAPLTSAQPFSVSACVDGFANCVEITGNVASLQPGDVYSLTIELPPVGAGNHTLNVEVDGRGEVAESNESDNVVLSSFNT